MDTEIWKQCGERIQTIYFISNKGNVKSIRKDNNKEKILKPTLNKDGYGYISICKKEMIHILVALHFIGPRPDGKVIDHIDRNKLNNSLSNLRYCSLSENSRNTNFFREDIEEQDSKKREKILQKERNERFRMKMSKI